MRAERILRVRSAFGSLEVIDREVLSLPAARSALSNGLSESSPRCRMGKKGCDVGDDSAEQFILLNQLGDEFANRYRRGERPALEEYIDRHPELADEIREFFPAMAEIEQVKVDGDEAAEPPSLRALPALERLGDYRIIREIGRGGMGIVYEAEQISLGRRVALKALPRQLLADARTKYRFEREARSAARLHHTNIVPVFGVGEHDGLPYFVMQFIQGLGLDQVITELRRLNRGTNDDPDRYPGQQRSARLAQATVCGRPEKLQHGRCHSSLVVHRPI